MSAQRQLPPGARDPEALLRESEARYRTIAELVPGFVYEAELVDDAWRMQWVSPGFERVYGCSMERFNELGLRHFYGPEQMEGLRERARRLRAGEDVRAEVPVRDHAGRRRWILLAGRPLRDPHTGAFTRLAGLVEDITDRKLAEERLRDGEERFRLALEAVDGIIYEYEADKRYVRRSRGVEEVLGYRQDEIPPTVDGWRRLVHPDDHGALFDPVAAADAGVQVSDANYRVRHADGRYVELWDRRLVQRDAEGRVLRVVGCAMDVTRQRRTERLLAEAEAVAHVGSWELDVASGHLTWSAETFRIHEADPAAFAPTLDGMLAAYVDDGAQRVREHFARSLASGAAWDLELELVTRRGRRRWVRLSCRAGRARGRVERLYGACLDIDASKRNELLLEEQRAWLRLSMDAAALVAWRWYPRTDVGVLEYRSPAAGDPLPQQTTLQRWLEHVAEPDRPRVAAALERTVRDGSPTDEEYAFREGERLRRLVTRAIRVHDAGGAVLVGTTQDVTERRAEDERRRAADALLRSVAEYAPDFMTLVDRDMRIRFVNRPLRGVPPPELLGRTVLEFAVGDPETLRECVHRVLDEGLPLRIETQWRREDGRDQHFEHRFGPVLGDGGVTGVIVHSTDITERRQAERRARTQARVLATMLEGVAVVDSGGVLRLANPAFERMFGAAIGTLDGRRFDALLEPGARPPPPGGSGEFVGRRADGARFEAAAVASSLELGGEHFRVYVVQDVTERRTLERELLEIANREQRRIGSDLHDGLGQELTGVALMLRGLASRSRRGETVDPHELDELVALVNGAIESTRALARGLAPVELDRGGLVVALRELAARARELYDLEVRFRSRIAPRLALDAAAATHLYRIAQEALTNAARHARARTVELQLRVRDAEVVLSVTDDGVGIGGRPGRGARAARARAPDGANADPAPGAPPRPDGMGLRIMRYRAAMMGGTLGVAPHAPRGTRVTCRVVQSLDAPAHSTHYRPETPET